jgi:hypothetical protein
VLDGPLQGIVCYFLPALAPDDVVVGASLELLVVCRALGVVVMLGVGLIYHGRHDVVFAPGYEEQGSAIFVPEVHVDILVAGGEVGQRTGPHEGARRRDVVSLVYLV